MGSENTFAPELQSLVGQQIVLDTKGPFVYIGTLERIDSGSLLLSDVDVHDLRESASSSDRYLIQTLKHGIRVNRRSVRVLAREIVSVSLLSDIVRY